MFMLLFVQKIMISISFSLQSGMIFSVGRIAKKLKIAESKRVSSENNLVACFS